MPHPRTALLAAAEQALAAGDVAEARRLAAEVEADLDAERSAKEAEWEYWAAQLRALAWMATVQECEREGEPCKSGGG